MNINEVWMLHEKKTAVLKTNPHNIYKVINKIQPHCRKNSHPWSDMFARNAKHSSLFKHSPITYYYESHSVLYTPFIIKYCSNACESHTTVHLTIPISYEFVMMDEVHSCVLGNCRQSSVCQNDTSIINFDAWYRAIFRLKIKEKPLFVCSPCNMFAYKMRWVFWTKLQMDWR